MRAVVLAILFTSSSGLLAQNFPEPPCPGPARPIYAESGQPPNMLVWRKASDTGWMPPSCTGWPDAVSNPVVALAGTLAHSGGADQLLSRFGAISTTTGIRYWSVTDKEWRVLVNQATALEGNDVTRRRSDFSALEMRSGQNLYFAQRDSRSTGEVVYRMRVREAGADRLVVEVENASPVRTFFLTIFGAGAMKTLYFLDRRGNGGWGFYALLSVDSLFSSGNEASLINRAAAYYRHFAGVPTDGAPPLAR